MGDATSDRTWGMTYFHATKCEPGDKVYAYSGVNGGTIYVDSVFGRLFKVMIQGVECPQQLKELDKAQMVSPSSACLSYISSHFWTHIPPSEIHVR